MEIKLNIYQHLTFWYNKTDEECFQIADGDIEQAFLNLLERNLCISISNDVVKELMKKK